MEKLLRHRPLTVPLKVAIAYATFAALWILLSDRALEMVLRDPTHFTAASTLKGWLFVAVTSVLLFGLVNRLLKEPQPLGEGAQVHHTGWWRTLVYLFAISITLGAVGIRLAMSPALGDRPFLNLLLCPIILSAFAGGLGPGLVSAAIAGLASGYFVFAPLHSLRIDQPLDLLQWAFLLANGLLVSILSEVFHRSRRQVEAQWRLQAVTLESIGDAVIATDAKGNVTFLNTVAERLTGWTCRDAIGHPLPDVFTVLDEMSREPAQDPVRTALFSSGGVGLADHTLLVSRDGREVPIQDNAAAIRLPSGRVLGVVLVFRDDSERRNLVKAQAEKLDALGLLEAIAGGSSDAIFAKDPEGRYLLFNRESARITGKSPEEVLGKDDTALFPPEEAGHLMALGRRVMAEDRALTTEEVLTTSEGVRVFLATKEPLRNREGRIIGLFGISRDITERKRIEQEVLASEARFHGLFEHMVEGLAHCRLIYEGGTPVDFVYLAVNPAFERLTGLKDVVGRNVSEVLPGRSRERHPAQFDLYGEIAAGGPPRKIETFIEEQGVWLSMSLYSPAPGEFISVFDNITERKLAEQVMGERLALQEQLSSIALSVPGVICSFKLRPDGSACMPFTTPAVLELYGISQAELAESVVPWSARVHPEDLGRVNETIAASAAGMVPWHDEYRYHHPDKGLRWIEGWSIPTGEPDGSIVWHGFVTDVTERKLAEEALREGEANLERAQAIAKIGSWRLEIGTGEVAWSREACRIFGVAQDAALDTERFSSRIHPEDRERVNAAWEQALAGEPFDVEHRILAGDEVKWVRERAEVRRDGEGRPVLGFGTVQDITERKRGEIENARLQAQFLQAQKLESIGRLAGGVAHDFNNMLQVITGNAELALSRLDPADPLHGEILLIKKASERSADLTRQLLAFARRQTISPKVLDLNDAVANMLKMLGRLVSEDIRLVWVPKRELWKTRVDPAQLDQILANLTVNARDAIEGIGTITLQTDQEVLTQADCSGVLGASPGAYVTLSIGDTGHGMGPDILEHIFEPFFTTKGPGKGTGLGLATVFGIAQQHGGFVRVSSRFHAGSVFKVYFPRFLEEGAAEEPRPERDLRRGHGETILLVEDEEALLLVGEAMLKELGYAVISVGSPELALQRVQATGGRIHLFLIDVVMPGMNGRQLAHRLATLRPEVPVLFMSGYTADVLADRGTVEEGLSLIPKPFSMQELSRRIRELLDPIG